MKATPFHRLHRGLALGLLLCQVPLLEAQQRSIDQKLNQILMELEQIRELLDNRDEDPLQRLESAVVDVGDTPMLGLQDAPFTIVEFTDYQCPYCRQFHERTFGDLKRLYIETGKVRFYVMNLPGENHPDASRAAQAGHCVSEVGGDFWTLHERMQASPERLNLENIVAYAAEINVDADAFRSCLESGRYKETVRSAAQDAIRLGVQGTPTFVVGKSTRDGVEGEWVVGAMPLGVFQKKIETYSANDSDGPAR